jgi:hypothetical protein
VRRVANRCGPVRSAKPPYDDPIDAYRGMIHAWLRLRG